jgi:glucosamine--fructose-6-phosphate aminotransferase (isomerizing)
MDREVVKLTRQGFEISTISGETVEREVESVTWSVEDAEKGGYEHYMLKEIFEQPMAIHNSLLGRIPDLTINEFLNGRFTTIRIIACGTSYHAGLIGKYIFENFSKIPVVVEMGSEYRYSEPIYENTLVVLITQSGETADTLAAAREAKRRGCMTIAITNVVGSSITREVDYTFYTRAGPEIGVAATKTYITQLVALYILGITLGLIKRSLEYDKIRELTSNLRKLSRFVQSVLDDTEHIEKCAMTMVDATDVFYIGRNINYPTALEGALKFKEISYIHAEGYPAGELKHGPLALLTPKTPVVAIAPKDHTYEKMLGNISEVSARGSPVIAIGYQDDTELAKIADNVIYIPEVPPLFSPVPISVVVQLLAYYVARERNCEIDKPRHLAKSVTVE